MGIAIAASVPTWLLGIVFAYSKERASMVAYLFETIKDLQKINLKFFISWPILDT